MYPTGLNSCNLLIYHDFKLKTRIFWTPMLAYKYHILEKVIVENIIPRNVIINQGAAEVDYNISRDDSFDYDPLKNGTFI